MIDDAAMLRAIRHDIRAWPGGRSIHDDYEPDVYAPTTLAVVVLLLGLPADHPLIGRAQSADWAPRDAEALLDLIADHLAERASAGAGAAFAAKLQNAARARGVAAPKNARLSPAQRHVLVAAAELGLSGDLLVRGTPAKIAIVLNKSYPNITSSDVARRIREMRKKGLLPQQSADA